MKKERELEVRGFWGVSPKTPHVSTESLPDSNSWDGTSSVNYASKGDEKPDSRSTKVILRQNVDIQRLFDQTVVVQGLRPLRRIRVLTQLTAERQLPAVTPEETVFAVTFFHEMVSFPIQNYNSAKTGISEFLTCSMDAFFFTGR